MTAISGFVIQDEYADVTIGFDPIYTSFMLISALFVAGLGWGIHKKMSLTCLIILLLLVIADIVVLSIDSDNVRDLIGSCVIAYLLIRGIFGLRALKKAFREYQQETNSPNHGLESTSAPPAAGTLETHP